MALRGGRHLEAVPEARPGWDEKPSWPPRERWESRLGRTPAGVLARWRWAIASTAVVVAAAAVWVTLRADFLAYPRRLALQKADLILGPVLVGLYWLRVRPQSDFGPVLVAFGRLGAGYVAQSSATPWL